MKLTKGNGITLSVENLNIKLDSKFVEGDISFISHAHFDHLINRNTMRHILCSNETRDIIKCRCGLELNNIQELSIGNTKFTLKNSGHILGSSSLVVENDESKLIYTGDFCIKNRGPIKGYQHEKCDILVIETTYGIPEYFIFNIEETISEARDWIEDNLKCGKSVILLGYSLGKAQILLHYFGNFNCNYYAHNSILRINEIYEKYGIKVRSCLPYQGELKGQFILVFPPSSPEIKKIREKYDAKVAIFSGWGNSKIADESFQISDHCDFVDLLKTVKESHAKKIYTIHGFSREFANYLRERGYDAENLDF